MDNFDDKALSVKNRLEYCVNSITRHIVSRDWYKMNVDMFNIPDEPSIEIVQFTYNYDCYAMPNYMTYAKFMTSDVDDIVDEMAI